MATVLTYAASGYYSYTVPADVKEVYLEMWGARGTEHLYNSVQPSTFVSGAKTLPGKTTGYLDVLPGQVLHFFVGSNYDLGDKWPQGANFPGWNTDGATWGGGGGGQGAQGGNAFRGGGASFVCRDAVNRSGILAVAGGGGGAGQDGYYGGKKLGGGQGGGLNGGNVAFANSRPGGGTQTAGGVPEGAGGDNAVNGDATGLGVGGPGTGRTPGAATGGIGGGGGGGWHGGGGGGWNGIQQGTVPGSGQAASFIGAGGGGGSGYIAGLKSGAVSTIAVSDSPNHNAPSGYIRMTISNRAPNAPQLYEPANDTAFNVGDYINFSWGATDPDTSDIAQTKFDFRWRGIGSSTWTVSSSQTTTQSVQFYGSTFAAGPIEWQVRTYDSAGLVGPYSGSRTFSIRADALPPTITYPSNNATISSGTDQVRWEVPTGRTQQAYRVRKLADSGGNPDTGNVLFDTGDTEGPVVRAYDLAFPVNNRVEHVQVRIRIDGVWSPYTSVKVTTNYTPPAQPSFTVTVDQALQSFTVTVTNPSGGTGVASNDVYVDDGDGRGFVRRARGLASGSSWTNWTPRSRWDYDGKVKVIAIGSNGATSERTGP